MSALTGFSYSANIRQALVTDKTKFVKATLTFGDGALTYPALGIPLDKAQFGFRAELRALKVIDNSAADGYVYKWDSVNNTIRIYQTAGTAAHAHDLLLKNAAVSDGATTRVNAGANLLGANTGGDLTVAGGGANGGVKLSTVGSAAALIEVTTAFAPAATTLIVEAEGR